jgi:chromosomal replication initiation ATPase DnaA
MQMFAFKNTEAGIARRQIATFETCATFQTDPRDKWKSTVIMTPFKRIEQRACKVFKVSLVELRSARRNDRVAFARQFIYYWATRLTPMSLGQIGRLVGGRDHTTVFHGRDVYPKKRAKMGRHLREVR